MCPLNTRQWDGGKNENPTRLGLYVSREMYRWFDCTDGGVRRCAGKVTAVSVDRHFTIKYDDGDVDDDATEADLLQIFDQMKKDAKAKTGRKKRTRVSKHSAGGKGKRVR